MSLIRAATSIALGIALFGAALAVAPSHAQEPRFTEFHDWTDLATIYNFSSTFRYDGDYGVRGLLTDSEWTLVYLRPSVRFKSKDLYALHGGAALFYNFFESTEDLPEVRPWVGIRFKGPQVSGWTLYNYFRLEGRAFYLKSSSEWDTVLRGRWQVQVTTPRYHIGSWNNFYSLAFVELFDDITTGVDGGLGDRFRFDLGTGNHVSENLRIELNYLFHTVRFGESFGDFEADDHVVRLRMFWTIH